MKYEHKRIWGTLDPFHETGPVLGRKVANTGFLNALLAADPFDEYHFFIDGGQNRTDLQAIFERLHPQACSKMRVLDRRDLPARISKTHYHCFHQSDCVTTMPELIRLRNAYAAKPFPVTGTIHSLSYAEFGMQFMRHLWPGNTAMDRIICTSGPGREVLRKLFDGLRSSYGLADSFQPPESALIPLGVDVARFTSQAAKTSDGPVRILVFGRISHHSKMDLVPLIRAMHRLFSQGLPTDAVTLVLGGWVDENDDYLPAIEKLAKNIGLQLEICARPDEREKAELFRNANIFVSIADNPQETFGITVIEAAAAGLALVLSDYDGYRDFARHGENALLVPTTGPTSTADINDMAPVLFQNHAHLPLAQRTAVDIPALADSLRELIEAPALRNELGTAAKEKALARYDWAQVIEEYTALWDKLQATPVDLAPLRTLSHPMNMNFAELFAHYTSALLPERKLRAGITGNAFYRGKDFPVIHAGLEQTLDMEIVRKIVFHARKPIDSGDLISKLSLNATNQDFATLEFHVLWSLKHDILEVCPHD